MPPLPLDHLTILSSNADASAAWYGALLPRLGFTRIKTGIWRNAHGLYLQFAAAKPGTYPYERHGAGLNHLGFTAPDPGFVQALAMHMQDLGHEARLQKFGDGVVALFLPDPDGLRVEVSWYPEGVPPVDGKA